MYAGAAVVLGCFATQRREKQKHTNKIGSEAAGCAAPPAAVWVAVDVCCFLLLCSSVWRDK